MYVVNYADANGEKMCSTFAPVEGDWESWREPHLSSFKELADTMKANGCTDVVVLDVLNDEVAYRAGDCE